MKAVAGQVSEKWVLLYIRRWLEAPVQTKTGVEAKAGMGTPQGGVVSPLLANLFLYYVLDKWPGQQHRGVTFVRYADDVVVHCSSEAQSQLMLQAIKARLAACKLRLNKEKTKIVHCNDYRRAAVKGYPVMFDFLGYRFKPMSIKSNRGGMFLGFGCEVSMKSRGRIISKWKAMNLHRQTAQNIQVIAPASTRSYGPSLTTTAFTIWRL